jgi:hypothetical protein
MKSCTGPIATLNKYRPVIVSSFSFLPDTNNAFGAAEISGDERTEEIS